jgi:hypothetical protein
VNFLVGGSIFCLLFLRGQFNFFSFRGVNFFFGGIKLLGGSTFVGGQKGGGIKGSCVHRHVSEDPPWHAPIFTLLSLKIKVD